MIFEGNKEISNFLLSLKTIIKQARVVLSAWMLHWSPGPGQADPVGSEEYMWIMLALFKVAILFIVVNSAWLIFQMATYTQWSWPQPERPLKYWIISLDVCISWITYSDSDNTFTLHHMILPKTDWLSVFVQSEKQRDSCEKIISFIHHEKNPLVSYHTS